MAVVPSVLARPKPPGPTGSGTDGKPDKKGDKKQAVPEPEPEPELNQDGGKRQMLLIFKCKTLVVSFLLPCNKKKWQEVILNVL